MRLSQEKRDKIAEQILSFLYHRFPMSFFCAELAREHARDEEFIKALMFDLKEKNLVIAIKKNPKGDFYSRRIRWRLSNQAYSAYKQHV
jgi:predicted transcriptional regulator with HTH domain